VEPTPTQAPVQASAPDIGRRFAQIMDALARLVAERFCRNPLLGPLTLLLHTRLRRAGVRFEHLMARIAANRPRRPGPSRPRPGRPHRPPVNELLAACPPLPTARLWLIRAIPYEAACLASQLQHLMAEPAAADLLAAHPEIYRILRPLGRMLGIDAFTPERVRAKPTPQPEAPETATPKAAPPKPPSLAAQRAAHRWGHPEDPTYRPSAKWPRKPWPERRWRRPKPA
jgi:hypothetical protein